MELLWSVSGLDKSRLVVEWLCEPQTVMCWSRGENWWLFWDIVFVRRVYSRENKCDVDDKEIDHHITEKKWSQWSIWSVSGFNWLKSKRSDLKMVLHKFNNSKWVGIRLGIIERYKCGEGMVSSNRFGVVIWFLDSHLESCVWIGILVSSSLSFNGSKMSSSLRSLWSSILIGVGGLTSLENVLPKGVDFQPRVLVNGVIFWEVIGETFCVNWSAVSWLDNDKSIIVENSLTGSCDERI